MVLTDRQRSDLHAGIYEYLCAQDGKYFEEAADALAEADPSCIRHKPDRQNSIANGSVSTIGDDSTVMSRFSRMTTASTTTRSSANLPILERKWTTVPRLQRKVLELEKALAANARRYANGTGIVHAGSQVDRRMLPREPATHMMPGHGESVTCLAIHPTYTICASGSEDSTIKIWDHESGEYRRTLKGHTNSVRSVAFTPSGNYIASSSSDLTIKLWDIQSYNCIRTLRGHDHTISAVKFVPLSQQYLNDNAASQNQNGGGDDDPKRQQTSTGIDALDAGCAYLVSASRDKSIKFWDVETGFVNQTIEQQDWVRCLAVRDSDGELVAAAGNELSINIYQTHGERNIIANLVGHEQVVESLAFLSSATPKELMGKKDAKIRIPENDYLVSGGRDRSVRVWNVVTHQMLNVFKIHENWVRSVALHPSGKYVISAGDDRTIRVLDLKSNRALRTLAGGHSHFVTSLAIHHTFPIMVSGSVDQNVNCWSLE